MSDLLDALAPIVAALADLDLTDRRRAEDTLARRLDAATMARATDPLRAAHAAGVLTPRQATATLRFGRVAKPSEATRQLAIDAVDIAGAGAGHRHPRGEVSWCVPLEGTPTFEGATSGWVVLPPGSRHVPTVEGGRMLICYFLPDGAVDWGD